MPIQKPPLLIYARLVFGLVLFGFGLALVVLGGFGVSPWEVLHQGISRRTPLSIGTTIILVGIIILLFLFLLKEPMGVGTIANVLIIGLIVDLTLSLFGEISNIFPRVIATLFGPIFVALGSGFYIGTRLGPGPRDGLMTAFNRRGVAIWKARTLTHRRFMCYHRFDTRRYYRMGNSLVSTFSRPLSTILSSALRDKRLAS